MSDQALPILFTMLTDREDAPLTLWDFTGENYLAPRIVTCLQNLQWILKGATHRSFTVNKFIFLL